MKNLKPNHSLQLSYTISADGPIKPHRTNLEVVGFIDIETIEKGSLDEIANRIYELYLQRPKPDDSIEIDFFVGSEYSGCIQLCTTGQHYWYFPKNVIDLDAVKNILSYEYDENDGRDAIWLDDDELTENYRDNFFE